MDKLEKVIKAIDEWINDQNALDTKIDACLVADALELLKERRWIPVTERLPREMTNKVLVYLQHEDYVGYIGYGHYEKFQGEEMWYDLEHGEQFAKRGYIVTHWMPSPQPPKDG